MGYPSHTWTGTPPDTGISILFEAPRALPVAPAPPRLLDRVCHTIRASESGTDIRTIQELVGHRDVTTTMIYTRVLNKGGLGVRSPLD